MTILFGAAVILAWGFWLVPSQNIKFGSTHTRTLYISLAFLAIALVRNLFAGFGGVGLSDFLLIALGGFIWSVSGWFAFVGTEKIGMSRAAGIWAPLNIVAGLVWGIVLFGEFPDRSPSAVLALVGSLALIFGGILFILRSKKSVSAEGAGRRAGIGGAVMAGILWGSYFIPVKFTGATPWQALFPQAVGMVAGAGILLLLSRGTVKLASPAQYLRTLASGIIWSAGNLAMLLLVDRIGAGKGFTIAQLSLLVNAAAGILILKDPPLRSKGAILVGAGIVLATIGGTLLGTL